MKLLTKWQVVIDSNVFVSALIWGGLPVQVINLWQQGAVALLISPYLLSEILLVLQRFNFPQYKLENFREDLEKNTTKLLPKRRVKICRDEKDNQILDLCLAGRANFLITGDKDLLVLKDFHSTKILKPQEFLKRF